MLVKSFYINVIRSLIIFSLVLVGLIVTISVSYGQANGWSQPVPLSSQDLPAWFPDIATDVTGRIHVVWASAILATHNSSLSRDYDTVAYTTSQDGQNWEEVNNVIAFPMSSGDEATRPGLLTDLQGILHMTLRFTGVYYSQAPVELAASVTSWHSLHQVSSFQVAYFSRLAVDGKGRLHLVFTENVPSPECQICFHLFYRWSDDNGLTWSNITDISKIPMGSAKPQILIDGQDSLHIVWEAGQGGAYGQLTDPTKVVYAASYDRGKTWTSPVEFIAPGGIAKNITIGLDGRGKLVVAWLDENQDMVYYQFSSDQGRSWSPPQPIPGLWGGWSIYAARLDDYAMATDSAGDSHLVIVGRTSPDQKSLDVLHLLWDGATWSQPEIIANYVGDVAEWPRVAVGNGNQLHVVWYVRNVANIWDTVDKSKPHRVWYAHGSALAPALVPVIWPTHTPTPESKPAEVALTSTPVHVPTPTSALNPALAPLVVPPGAFDSIYTDSDEVMLLTKSLIPVVLVIGAVIFAVRFRRH